MRKTLSAFVLMLALCTPAIAGDILCPSAPQPPPSVSAQGQVGDGDTQSGAVDTLTEAVLNVFESVLALF